MNDRDVCGKIDAVRRIPRLADRCGYYGKSFGAELLAVAVLLGGFRCGGLTSRVARNSLPNL
jgi:hypothetical protein